MTNPTLSTESIPNLPEKLKPLEKDTLYLLRELPRLLEEGEAGRFAVVKDQKLFGTWDTYQDASQYAHEKFAIDDHYLVHKVDARELERWRQYYAQRGVSCPF